MSCTLPEVAQAVEKLNVWDYPSVAALPAGQRGATLQCAAGEQLEKLGKLLQEVAGQETSGLAFEFGGQT